MKKDCDKKEKIKKDSHKRERFSQMIINKKRFKKYIKAEHARVSIKRNTIDLLKNHIYSKNEALREYFTSPG